MILTRDELNTFLGHLAAIPAQHARALVRDLHLQAVVHAVTTGGLELSDEDIAVLVRNERRTNVGKLQDRIKTNPKHRI